MIVEELKKSILNYAICGNLSFRIETDTPVDKMITNIQKIREESIKSKIAKNDKYKKIDENMLFNIPDSWRWVRVGEIGNWGSGSTPERGNTDYYDNGTISWLKTGELNDGFVGESNEKITELALEKCSLKMNKPGDILIAMYGATIGKLGIVTVETTTNQACCGCSIYADVNNKYLFYYLLGIRGKLISMGEGSGQPNISREKIINLPFPLPPIEEQDRIVNTIDELFEKLDYIKPIEEELSDMKLKFPDIMKKSILYSAICGNVSYQSQDDTPVDKQLELIEKEKDRYSKENEIKNSKRREKNYKYLTDDKYKLPESWKYVSLYDATVSIFSGKSPVYSKNPNDNLILGQKVNQEDGLHFEDMKYGTSDFLNTLPLYQFLKKNDILLNTLGGGSVGRCGIYDNDNNNVTTDGHIFVIRTNGYTNEKYIMYYLRLYRDKLEDYANGTTNQKFFNIKQIEDLMIPLPPIEEQKRIVENLEKILPLCENLKRIVE